MTCIVFKQSYPGDQSVNFCPVVAKSHRLETTDINDFDAIRKEIVKLVTDMCLNNSMNNPAPLIIISFYELIIWEGCDFVNARFGMRTSYDVQVIPFEKSVNEQSNKPI